MFGKIGNRGKSRFAIAASVDPVQIVAPPSKPKFEGIAFSSSGEVIAVADAESNTVFMHRRRPDGLFEDTPYSSLGGAGSGLEITHDVSFSPWRDTELLVVAQRRGVLTIYQKDQASQNYGPDPVFEISGSETKLNYTDGVAFVPPNNRHIAACNIDSVTFFRRVPARQICFELEPIFELRHPSLGHPDGLAFSRCGRWLALASHSNHSVCIFRRRNRMFTGGRLEYGPAPVTVIKDQGLRYPHSVAFTPKTNHLVVTNSGANHFSAYEPLGGRFGRQWSQSPVLQRSFGPDHLFREANDLNGMEGGPKGVAIHGNSVAVCSPELGVKIYSFGL